MNSNVSRSVGVHFANIFCQSRRKPQEYQTLLWGEIAKDRCNCLRPVVRTRLRDSVALLEGCSKVQQRIMPDLW